MERMKRVTVLIVYTLLIPYAEVSQFNVAELKETIYEVNIDAEPLGVDEHGKQVPVEKESLVNEKAGKGEQIVLMTSEYGQKFFCTLPMAPARKEEEESGSAKKEFSTKTIGDVVSAGFYTRKCTKREMAWWTYEVCYGSEVKQYHSEVTGTVTSMMSLGYFTKNLDLPSFKPKPDRPLYFEQQYTNGTICDLTGKPRTTVVRYYCEELLETDEVYIDEVDESSTCEYLIRIKSGSLCKIGEFLPVGRPRDPLGIKCRPFLEGDQIPNYRKQLEREKAEKRATEKMIELLDRQAASLQKQRYARKRLALKEPNAARKAKAVDKRLKEQYEALIRESWRLNAQFSDAVEKDMAQVIVGDVDETDESYPSLEDEESANVYWYFKDPFWDKKYFPPTRAYVRALNKFDLMLKEYGEFFPRELQMRHLPGVFPSFLQRVEEGTVTEADLSNVLGPLAVAFAEDELPSIDSDVNIMLTDDPKKWSIEKRQKAFENRVIDALLRGIRYEPRMVMGKVARDLLAMRNLQERMYKLSYGNAAKMPSSYANIERIFMMFQEAYNRAVIRYEKDDYEYDSYENVVDGYSLPGEWDDVQPKDLHPENAKLLYFDELAKELHEVFPESKSGAAWEENRARSRMERRAKRHNLKQLVEAYFRTPSLTEEWAKQLSVNSISKKRDGGVKVMKDLLKKLLKGTGVPEEADVTVHLVTTDGEIIGTSGDDSKIANLVKAWLEEQSTISDEIDRQYNLDKAYSFGASKEERDARKGNDQPSRSDLPIIREML